MATAAGCRCRCRSAAAMLGMCSRRSRPMEAQCGHGLGAGAAVGLGLVFAEGAVAHPVQALDAPVAADEPAEICVAGLGDRRRRRGTRRREAGQPGGRGLRVRSER